MSENKKGAKYFLPACLVAIVVSVLISGIFFIQESLMKMMREERSNQLEEMVTQIQANLDSGLHTHWNLVSGLNNAIQGNHFVDGNEVFEMIAHLENDFCTNLYGSRVMLLDEQGTAYLSDGSAGIWYDISHLLDGEKRHTFVSETDTIDGSFMVFSQELDSPVTMGDNNLRFTHVVLLKDIRTLKSYYTTTTYGGNAATYIIKKNGTMAYFDAQDDIIGARNVYHALEDAEYVQGRNFEMIRDELEQEGIVAADIILNETEYYYCLTSLDDYDMTLMLVIPADDIAVNTMNMMNSAIMTETVFISAMAVLILLAFYSLMRVQQSSQEIKGLRKNPLI